MAPERRDVNPPGLRLQLSLLSSMAPLSHSTTCLTTIANLDDSPPSPSSPRALYAASFDRPVSSRSMPNTRYRKNMKEMTGFTTTEEEFDALPLAVRRKVRTARSAVQARSDLCYLFLLLLPPRLLLHDGPNSAGISAYCMPSFIVSFEAFVLSSLEYGESSFKLTTLFQQAVRSLALRAS